METFTTFQEAAEAAQEYFSTVFGYNNGVGIESETDNVVEFYSKDDPGMDDTYYCIIQNTD